MGGRNRKCETKTQEKVRKRPVNCESESLIRQLVSRNKTVQDREEVG